MTILEEVIEGVSVIMLSHGHLLAHFDLQAPSSIGLVCTVQKVLDHLSGPAIRQFEASDVVRDDEAREEEHWSTVFAGPEAFLVLESLEELESVASRL